MKREQDWGKEIIEKCTECGKCAESCRLLTHLNESPKAIAKRGVAFDDAYGCALCGKCETACHLGLSPYRMFEEGRVQAVKNGELELVDYQYLFPDRPVTVMSLFREYYGVDYSDLNETNPGDTAFFPGCSLLTYSPKLTKKVYQALEKEYPNLVFFDNCCGIPMYHIGLPERGDKLKAQARIKAQELGVKRFIIACPNCYYQFKNQEGFQDFEIMTVIEALKGQFVKNQNSRVYAVHDACPDRFDGIYAKQVREALDENGYKRVEMKHHGKDSVCCGSSGQMGHFHPEWSTEHETQNLTEAEEAGADTLLATCHACVLNFGNIDERKVEVRHILNILLDYEENYDEVKGMAAKMFDGEEGMELYLKLYEDPE
ncbi:MAG: (Fe-S)-binding protein [Desulfitobacterium sp.]|nr:(Fe-S)-binding protein [Desulfitobacterium sp.]